MREPVGDGGPGWLVVGHPALVEAYEPTTVAAALLVPATLRFADNLPPPPKPPKPRISPWTRDQLIIEASKIALSRRYADDKERFEAAQRLAGEDPEDQFDAQLMLSCLIFVLDEMGAEAVMQIRHKAEARSYR